MYGPKSCDTVPEVYLNPAELFNANASKAVRQIRSRLDPDNEVTT